MILITGGSVEELMLGDSDLVVCRKRHAVSFNERRVAGFLIAAGSTIHVLYVETEGMGRSTVTVVDRRTGVQCEDLQNMIKTNERARFRLIPAAVGAEQRTPK